MRLACSAAWTLSDELGLTNGEYNAQTNESFTRADVVLIFSRALDTPRKGPDRTLPEVIMAAEPSRQAE